MHYSTAGTAGASNNELVSSDECWVTDVYYFTFLLTLLSPLFSSLFLVICDFLDRSYRPPLPSLLRTGITKAQVFYYLQRFAVNSNAFIFIFG